jgi:hypothetical protein
MMETISKEFTDLKEQTEPPFASAYLPRWDCLYACKIRAIRLGSCVLPLPLVCRPLAALPIVAGTALCKLDRGERLPHASC